MTLFNDYIRSETRRQFLGRGVNAVGWAALASLLGAGRRPAGDDGKGEADAACPLDHFPPRPSRSSICTWSAGRRRWTCTTTSRR